MADIIPGILEQSFDVIREKVGRAAPHVKTIHIDLADGTMVPVTTPLDFSAFKELIAGYPDVRFEAHLLVANPDKYLREAVDSGFRRLFFHVESNDPRRFLSAAKYEEVEVGAALDGASGVEELEPFIEEVDCVLIAAIEEGKSGQTFMPEALEKIKKIRQNFADISITVVGGINDVTAPAAREAGATRLVSTSYLYRDPAGFAEALEALGK